MRDKTIIMTELATLFVIDIKKIGAVPRKRPIVVNPKAKPGFSLYTLAIIPRVMAIVIENSITPNSDMNIKSSPIIRNGIARMTLSKPTFLIPKASDNIPPRHFPIPIVKNSMTVCNVVLFQLVGIPYPIYPRTMTTKVAKRTMIKGLRFKVA